MRLYSALFSAFKCQAQRNSAYFEKIAQPWLFFNAEAAEEKTQRNAEQKMC